MKLEESYELRPMTRKEYQRMRDQPGGSDFTAIARRGCGAYAC